jgi:NAD(P)-dependent dehydrogenase (short-subunit alcohol dehydrogenase family)
MYDSSTDLPEPRNRVRGKAAMVVGAGSILPGWSNGRAAATLYGREGAKVFAIDRDEASVEETRRLIEDAGGECTVYVADALDADDIASAVEACRESYGRIDILHNNVGGSGPGSRLMDITEEDWTATLHRNVTTAFLSCKAVVPVMAAQGGGAIVNVSSIASLRHIGMHTTAYSAGKGALNELTKNIAIQYAKANIRANCVLPGLMNTPFIHRDLGDGRTGYERRGYDSAEAYHAARDAVIPMGRMGDAWDVAYAALFLASDEAAYVTGQMLVVDGGLTTTTPGM